MTDDTHLRKKMIDTADYLDGLADTIEKYNVDRFPGPLAKDLVIAIKECREAAASLRAAAESGT